MWISPRVNMSISIKVVADFSRIQKELNFFPPLNLQFVCSQVTKQLKGLFFYYSGETLNTKVDTY